MMVIHAGKPAIEMIRLCYQSGRPVMLIGSHGIGKSQILEAAAKALNIDFICRDLSIMEPPDLTGMPHVLGGRTTFAPPAFLPTDGRGLIAFEELNRCPEHMRAPCLQLLTARCLNDYKLPPGWLPVAAMNPPGEGNYVVDELDPALLSRFVQVPLVPDTQEWLSWAETHDIHDSVISYIHSHPNVFDDPDSNPRAWTYVSDLVRAAECENFTRDSLLHSIAGLVGDKLAVAFSRSMKMTAGSMTADDILKHYKKCQPRVRSWINRGRLDLVKQALRSLEVQLQSKAEFTSVAASTKQAANLAAFIDDLPDDLRLEAEQFLAGRKYKLPQLGKKKAS